MNGFIRLIFIYVIYECSFYLYRWEVYIGDYFIDDFWGVISGLLDCYRFICW